MMALHESDPDWTRCEERCLKRLFGLGEEVSEAELTEQLADVLADSDIDALIAALEGNGAESRTDQELRDGLRAARSAAGAARVAALKPIFLTDKNTPRRTVCSKGLRQAEPQLCAVLDRAQSRFDALATQRAQLACAEASAAVLLLADTIQAEYARAKESEAVLDYDDLILKTQALLSRAGAAAWVLFKIDGGVDHILVDEAQDTNPEQWSIIERLAEEFFAGEGASDKLRTLFAVGDEKQSIYSFQGADPDPLRRGRTRRSAPRRWRSSSRGTMCRSPSRSARPSRCSRRSMRCSASAPPRKASSSIDGERHRAPRFSHRTGRPGRALAGRGRDEARAGRSLRALERGRRAAACRRCAVRAHRWADQGLARQGRRARVRRPQDQLRRHSDPGAPPRSLYRADDPRAEAGENRRRGRRSHAAPATDRRHGPRGPCRRAAHAGGRSIACRGAEEPALRAR